MVRALVVDDSRAMRMVMQKWLSSIGLECVLCASASDALQVLAANAPFAVAIVDWNMPGMTGLELLRHIRSKPEHDAMMLLMATTETDSTQVKRALDNGANEYLMKPFNEDSLRKKLALLEVIG